MSAKFFLDTNIIIYALEGQPQGKAAIAEGLINKAMETELGVISLQVVQETLNAITRKAQIAMSGDNIALLLQNTLTPLCSVLPTLDTVRHAMKLKDRYQYSFYDSLILTAALEAKCGVLYSEDLHDGQDIGVLKIVNPFA